MRMLLPPILAFLGGSSLLAESPQLPPWIDEQKGSQRVVSFDIVFDSQDKRVWTTHAGLVWLSKSDTRPNGTFSLEYFTVSGSVVREPRTLLGVTNPLNLHSGETNQVLVFHARVLSDEDGIGYRVINHADGSVLLEQHFLLPKQPLSITARYEPSRGSVGQTGPYPPAGIVVKASRSFQSLSCAWALDPHAPTWNSVSSCIDGVRPESLDPILKAYPGRDLFFEIQVAENLIFYRRLFKLSSDKRISEQQEVPTKILLKIPGSK